MVTKTEMRWLYDLVYPYVCFLLILIDSKWSNPQALCSILISVHCRRFCSIRTLWEATLWRRCPDICLFFSIKNGTPKNAHRTPWLARWIPCILAADAAHGQEHPATIIDAISNLWSSIDQVVGDGVWYWRFITWRVSSQIAYMSTWSNHVSWWIM